MTSRKLRPVLSEMPWHIKRKIVHSADAIVQTNLELSSKEYRSLVVRAPSFYEHLIIKIGLAYTQIIIPDPTNGRTKTFLKQAESRERFLDGALNHIEKMLKHPKSGIGKLELNVYHWEVFLIPELFRHLYNTRGTRLSVRNISLASTMLGTNLSPGFLEYLDLGALETICLTNTGSFTTTDLSPLTVTSQWKTAKKLEVNKFFMLLPYEKWAHFEFDVISVIRLSVETAKGIMENFFRKPSWKRVQVVYNEKEHEELAAYLGSLGFGKIQHENIENPFDESEIISGFSTKNWFWARRSIKLLL